VQTIELIYKWRIPTVWLWGTVSISVSLWSRQCAWRSWCYWQTFSTTCHYLPRFDTGTKIIQQLPYLQ